MPWPGLLIGCRDVRLAPLGLALGLLAHDGPMVGFKQLVHVPLLAKRIGD